MSAIRQEDVIESVADALQYISYYHPPDFIKAMSDAYDHEESQPAKAALAQVLVNSRTVSYTHLTLPTNREV